MQLYLHETFLTTLHVGLISIFACVTLPEHHIYIQTFVREFNTLSYSCYYWAVLMAEQKVESEVAKRLDLSVIRYSRVAEDHKVLSRALQIEADQDVVMCITR